MVSACSRASVCLSFNFIATKIEQQVRYTISEKFTIIVLLEISQWYFVFPSESII